MHEEQTPIVVNWQAPGRPAFYTATVADPQGVALRRRFRNEGRRLLDLYDEPLDGSAGDVIHGVADILLEELERSRDEHMRDIVATIQTDQYRLITLEPEGVLVIQGGPGTGKTAVGLHRASWLLYTYRRELERSGVLVVGPNPVFMDYISHVLPMLGEERVEQRAVDELVAGVEPSRHDEPAVARLKGDERLADVIAAAVRALPQPPSELLAVRLEGVELRAVPDQVAALVDEAQAESAEPRRRPRPPADEARARVLRAVHAAARRRRVPLLRRHRGRAPNRRLPEPDARCPLAAPEARQLVRRLLTQPEAPRRRGRGDPRRGRAAAAPVGPRQGLVRRRPAPPRRGAGAPRRARPAARPPDRRRGAGPDADAAAHAPRAGRRGAITILGDIAQVIRADLVHDLVGRAPGTWHRT